jgi:hypothetical protein
MLWAAHRLHTLHETMMFLRMLYITQIMLSLVSRWNSDAKMARALPNHYNRAVAVPTAYSRKLMDDSYNSASDKNLSMRSPHSVSPIFRAAKLALGFLIQFYSGTRRQHFPSGAWCRCLIPKSLRSSSLMAARTGPLQSSCVCHSVAWAYFWNAVSAAS